MASWKLGTCACRVSGVPGPYPYFRVPVATYASGAWSGSSTIRAGELIQFGSQAIYIATYDFSNPASNIDPTYYGAVFTGFSSDSGSPFVFRPRGFPIVLSQSGFGTVRGSLWQPPLTERHRRIVEGTAGGPLYPEWEVYRDGRNVYPDLSRPFVFKKWIESTTWNLNSGSSFRPNAGSMVREYRYIPEENREVLYYSRVFDESGNRIDVDGAGPVLDRSNGFGGWSPLYSPLPSSTIGAVFGWPNTPVAVSSSFPNSVNLLEVVLREDFQSWKFNSLGGVPYEFTQSITVSDPIS